MNRVKKLPLGKRKLSKPMDKEDIAIYKTANIMRRDICDELKDSYLAYSVSVITSRAIPHLKDGLKPSQRRILYVLKDAADNRKSARIVGDVLGKYHPHSDMSVYTTMVRLAQPFKMYVPYGIGQGNFGSLDSSDGFASPRYTEIKVNPETLDIFFKNNQLGVTYEKNYDNTLDIPEHLVPLIPMSLVNGTSGTAVGFATDFPTHNPKEVIDTYIAYMNGKLTNKNIRKYLKGPDPVMPCYIIDDVSIDRGYQTGRGSYYAMLPYEIEDEGRGRKRIVFTSVLPDKAKDSMIGELVLKCRDQKNPLSQMIADIRDESSKEGVRICVITKRDADLNATIEALINARFCYAKFNISNVLIVNGVPKRLGIIDMLKEFHKMNTETSVRHLTTLKENKERRLYILDGIELVIENYDTVIDIIRKSKGKEEAKNALQKKYKGLSDIQVAAILDTKLYTLINKGDSIKAERKVIKEEVKEINHNLKDIDGYILNLLEDLKKTLKPYAKRRCEIISKIPKTPV